MGFDTVGLIGSTLLILRESFESPSLRQIKTDHECDLFLFGGEMGIRTPDTVARIHTFQACSFNHSDTSPYLFVRCTPALQFIIN